MTTRTDEPLLTESLHESASSTSAAETALTAQLATAAEQLRHEQLDEVRSALDKLLKLAPSDVRVRNLHGLFLFRTERHAESRDVFESLLLEHPTDAVLRLNLGLVELKLGDHKAAAEDLRRVVAVEPGNQRAQGYLGLALMRQGELSAAQKAFGLAGQRDLEARVAAQIAELEQEGSLQRTELERAAGVGTSLLDGDQPFKTAEDESDRSEAPRSPGRWQLRAHGQRAPLPNDDGAGRTPILSVRSAEPVASFATARLLRGASTGDAFSLVDGGMLIVSVMERINTRTIGAVSSSAALTFEPLRRRVRGQSIDEVFGDEQDAIYTTTGRGSMVITPRGGHFVLLRLEDDIVYVRESVAFAFEASLAWENGRLPGAGPDVQPPRIVQFRGQGRLVLRSDRPLFSLKVEPDAQHIVDASTLVGWFGRVQPRLLRGEQGEPTPYIECSGEGMLLIEQPA